jgi:hypothetical protein
MNRHLGNLRRSATCDRGSKVDGFMESDWGMLERPSQHMDRSLSRSCRDSHDSSDRVFLVRQDELS